MNIEMKSKEEESPQKKDKLEMWCECCGDAFKRWEMDMVKPNEGFVLYVEEDDFGFACPHCVTDLNLIPLQTEKAELFRSRNEKLREVLAPTTIH